jgi:hypothetical protein
VKLEFWKACRGIFMNTECVKGFFIESQGYWCTEFYKLGRIGGAKVLNWMARADIQIEFEIEGPKWKSA